MKVMVIVKATPNSEKGVMANPEQLKKMFADMGKYNEQLVEAGIMQVADGLKPSSAGKRVTFTDEGHSAVIDGPFAEAKELVAGFWIWEVKSLDEAVEWAKRCPNPMPGEQGVLEIRPFADMADFAELMTDDHLERAEQMRKQIDQQQKRKAKQAPGTAKASNKASNKAPRKAPSKAKAKAKAKPAKRQPVRAKAKK